MEKDKPDAAVHNAHWLEAGMHVLQGAAHSSSLSKQDVGWCALRIWAEQPQLHGNAGQHRDQDAGGDDAEFAISKLEALHDTHGGLIRV